MQIYSEIVRITLNGQGKATVQVPSMMPGTPPAFPIFIRGKEITVKGFTFIGGLDGVHLSGAAAGASAIIENNFIRRTARFGIHIDSGSVAQIANNRIEEVGAAGIDIIEHSVARIGFLVPAQPALGPNIIHMCIPITSWAIFWPMPSMAMAETQLPRPTVQVSISPATERPDAKGLTRPIHKKRMAVSAFAVWLEGMWRGRWARSSE